MKTPRRRAREYAVQALYQSMFNDIATPELARNTREHTDFKNADDELFSAILFGVKSNKIKYMNAIRPYLERDENLINPIERCILLMATHELYAMPETPQVVVINEAIEVTKTFGGVDSHKFINSILDKVKEDVNLEREQQAEQAEEAENN